MKNWSKTNNNIKTNELIQNIANLKTRKLMMMKRMKIKMSEIIKENRVIRQKLIMDKNKNFKTIQIVEMNINDNEIEVNRIIDNQILMMKCKKIVGMKKQKQNILQIKRTKIL